MGIDRDILVKLSVRRQVATLNRALLWFRCLCRLLCYKQYLTNCFRSPLSGFSLRRHHWTRSPPGIYSCSLSDHLRGFIWWIERQWDATKCSSINTRRQDCAAKSCTRHFTVDSRYQIEYNTNFESLMIILHVTANESVWN